MTIVEHRHYPFLSINQMFIFLNLTLLSSSRIFDFQINSLLLFFKLLDNSEESYVCFTYLSTQTSKPCFNYVWSSRESLIYAAGMLPEGIKSRASICFIFKWKCSSEPIKILNFSPNTLSYMKKACFIFYI